MTAEDNGPNPAAQTKGLVSEVSVPLKWVGWLILAVFFSYMAMDDGAEFHERVGSAYKKIYQPEQSLKVDAEGENVKGLTYYPSYPWQVIFVPIFGVIAIFMYVGAEVSIGSNLIFFCEDVVGLNESQASPYVAIFWGGLMIGRRGCRIAQHATEHDADAEPHRRSGARELRARMSAWRLPIVEESRVQPRNGSGPVAVCPLDRLGTEMVHVTGRQQPLCNIAPAIVHLQKVPAMVAGLCGHAPVPDV